MLTRMAPLLTRMARVACMLTRMTRWLAYYTYSTVATEMKTSAKRQKANTLNKSHIKHDEGIKNTQLCLISLQDMIIFRDCTQNLIDGPLQAWREWILNRTYLLFGGRHFEIIRFPSVLCRPIQNCFKSEIPAKAPLTVPGRCYLCLMLSNTPHTGAKMTTKTC